MKDLSKVIKIIVSDLHNGMLFKKRVKEDHTGFFREIYAIPFMVSGIRQPDSKIQMQKCNTGEKNHLSISASCSGTPEFPFWRFFVCFGWFVCLVVFLTIL